MGLQIIQQPNGLFSVFSSVSDTICLANATQEEITEVLSNEAKRREEESLNDIFTRIKNGQKPYYQFTKTWDQALATHRRTIGRSIQERDADFEETLTRIEQGDAPPGKHSNGS